MKSRGLAFGLFAAAFAAVLPLGIMATADPRAAAAGWLVGFVFWCGPPVGSIVWLMIHRLTGGRWGVALHSTLASTAALVPVMAVLLLPTLAAMPMLYPWMRHGNSVIESVADFYLNAPSFVVRSVIAFVGWTILAIAVPRTTAAGGVLLSTLGLIFYCVLISLVPVDWILSLEHPFVSESFGVSVAITQLIAALVWAVLLARREMDAVEGDLGALLLAMVLAITYVDFMALLVIWYGDLPDKVFWFVERDHPPWSLLAIVALLAASAIPSLSLLLTRIRTSCFALRVVSAIELVGLAVYSTYLIVPPFGAVALISAALALIAIGGLLAGLMLAGFRQITFERWSTPHAG